jgi:5-methylcytosine-specific restriction endonuclease McrA
MAKFEITWLEDRSDEAVLAEIRRVAGLMPGRRLTVDKFDPLSKIKSTTVRERFGSWSAATRRAGLTDALPDYSDAAIIEDLRRVSDSCPNEPFTMACYLSQGRYSPSCVKRRFNGWREALDAAGIGNRFVGPLTTERMKSQPGRNMSDEDILAQIRAVSAHLGKATLSGTDIVTNSEITQQQMYSRFGSVSAALRKAGIEQVCHGRRHTEEEVFENLLNVWTHYGRPPTVSEMDRPPSTVGKNTYIHRYRGWRKALKAFVERANSQTEGNTASDPERDPNMLAYSKNSAEKLAPSTSGTGKPQSVSQVTGRLRVTRRKQTYVKPEDRRDPGIGLRFRVLQRDQFRCKRCGRSPATELGCVLHVDHITAFSKGGRTVFENLETLCSHCNIGKSNRTV